MSEDTIIWIKTLSIVGAILLVFAIIVLLTIYIDYAPLYIAGLLFLAFLISITKSWVEASHRKKKREEERKNAPPSRVRRFFAY
jgi:hypothetical protein